MKKKSLIIVVAVLAVIAIVVALIVGKYNTIVTRSEEIQQAMSNVDTTLQRRADLIPNLVNTVKGYAAHEQSAIDSVTEARAKLLGAKTADDKAAANDELTTALNALMVIVENYPDLKANENFIQLQDELAGTENRITVARRDYNDKVKEYNSYIKKFPTNVIANMFGFGTKEYFEASESANEVPSVNFE